MKNDAQMCGILDTGNQNMHSVQADKNRNCANRQFETENLETN